MSFGRIGRPDRSRPAGAGGRARCAEETHQVPQRMVVTMAAIIPPRREKNGRRSRAVDRQNAASRRLADLEQSIVLKQPHRRGEKSPLAECAVGRFVLAQKMDTEVFDAALQFQRRRTIYRAVVGAPRIDQVAGSGSSVDGPDQETVARWREEIELVEEAVEEQAGKLGMLIIDRLVDRDLDVKHMTALGKIALVALARALGRRV